MSQSNSGIDARAKEIYISRFASWAPGLSDQSAWLDWAGEKCQIENTGESPSLDFTEWLQLNPKDFALFKRRQSQISRMTLQVLYQIMPIGQETKIVFVSFRGEIQQQLKINRMLIEDEDISPAAFSQSVFNTPPALASIAFGLDAGYTAVYPGGGCFKTGFLTAATPLLTGDAQEIALVYADEFCPAEYKCRETYKPFAFAALLKTIEPGISISLDHDSLDSPESFLRNLYINGT